METYSYFCSCCGSSCLYMVLVKSGNLKSPKKCYSSWWFKDSAAASLASSNRLTGRFPSDWDLVIQVGEEAGRRGARVEEGRGRRGKAGGPNSPWWGDGGGGNAERCCCCCRPPLKMSLGINYHCVHVESRIYPPLSIIFILTLIC